MLESRSSNHQSSADTILGFIVSGHRIDLPIDSNARLVAVLANNQEDAFAAAATTNEAFKPTGCIAESELTEQIDLLNDLHLKNPMSKHNGFVIGGYVGEIPTLQGSGMIAMLAKDADEAIVQSVNIQEGFHPTGCISEAHLKKYASAIKQLRKNSIKCPPLQFQNSNETDNL